MYKLLKLKNNGKNTVCKCGEKACWEIRKDYFCNECALEEISKNYKLIPKFKPSSGSLKEQSIEFEQYKNNIMSSF